MSYFSRLEILPVIEKALLALEYQKPTPIQQKAIPIALKGVDLIGTAQTGTGKTAAYCVPMLTTLIEQPKKNALILAPTRELVLQIEKFWLELTQFCPEIKAVSIVGGVPMESQIRKLKSKPRLIIATPGRLVDLLQREEINLTNIGVLVLDEADRMLDMGFEAQITEVVRLTPKQRQTLFFSATWSPAVDELSKQFIRKGYERVTVGETSQAASNVGQKLLTTTADAKRDLLLDEINANPGTILVFTKTQVRADAVCDYLESYGVEVNRLHGGRSQGQRSTALKQFRSGKIRILVATDIAARGIDVAEIAHVVNYDLPQVAEDYVHRIGRTGRAGSSGTATTFLTSEDTKIWNDIVSLLKKTGSVVPAALKPTQARLANAADLEPESEPVAKTSKKPTRSHPQSRRENQWHRGSVVVKPESEQRIKPRITR